MRKEPTGPLRGAPHGPLPTSAADLTISMRGTAMERRTSWLRGRPMTAALAAVLLAACGGCHQLLFTAVYLFHGNNVKAEYKELRGKTVAVVCRPLATFKYNNNARAHQDVADQVGRLLQKNVSKIKVVSHRKVAEWMDGHNSDDYAEIAKAVGADVVVAIDLQQFDVLLSQTLYQGRAVAEVKVYDCKSGNPLFEKDPIQVTFPPNAPVSASDGAAEETFRRKFVRVLAERLARAFYDYEADRDYGLDSAAL